MNEQRRGFQPNWASAPGETIADVLAERGVSLSDFARQLGRELSDTADMIEGRASITVEVARDLERTLGASIEFWMARDYQYTEDLSLLDANADEWIDELPVAEMSDFGWIRPVSSSEDAADACMRFFGLTSRRAWRTTYAEPLRTAALRTSPSFESDPAAVAAWLRQGEIESARIDCFDWDADRFRQSLDQIRPLTRINDPAQLMPKLSAICAASGVAVVVVRAPGGCKASGVTRFVSPSKAVLQLSLRHLTNDHFWFTFFHEAGHLVLHHERLTASALLGGGNTWIVEWDGKESDSEEETEANEFAEDVLIPSEAREELLGLPASMRDIVRFAVRQKIAPGIVVWQLQHYGRIGFSQMNTLKRRYTWSG